MILKYVGEKQTDSWRHFTTEYKRKGVKYRIIKSKDFDDYKDYVEKELNQTVSVIRNTRLKELSENSDDIKNEEYLEIEYFKDSGYTVGIEPMALYVSTDTETKKFKITKEKRRFTAGYLPVGDLRFVRIQRRIWPLVLLLILLVGVFTGVCIATTGKPPAELLMDNTSSLWDGNPNDSGGSTASQENIVIPGFSTFTVTKGAALIKLYNMPENTVNFVYTITKPLSSEKVETFDDLDTAQRFANKNTVEYSNYYDESSGNYELKDAEGQITDTLVEYKTASEGGKYVVYKNQSKVIYFTNGIAPNMYVDWDAYASLGVGVHELQFRTSTYDVDTNVACYGSIQNVTITVN